MELSNRLEAIYELIDLSDSLADVGCDHGYLSIKIALGKKAKKIYATDIREGPLNIAKKNFISNSVSDKIIPLLGDGLKPLSEPVETIVIAGMGGHTMIDILTDSGEVVSQSKTLILSPHKDVKAVREFVSGIGFIIKDELIIKDNDKYYFILKCEKGICTEGVDFGYSNILIRKKDATYYEYLTKKIRSLVKVMESVPLSKKDPIIKKIKKMEEVCFEIKRTD